MDLEKNKLTKWKSHTGNKRWWGRRKSTLCLCVCMCVSRMLLILAAGPYTSLSWSIILKKTALPAHTRTLSSNTRVRYAVTHTCYSLSFHTHTEWRMSASCNKIVHSKSLTMFGHLTWGQSYTLSGPEHKWNRSVSMHWMCLCASINYPGEKFYKVQQRSFLDRVGVQKWVTKN